MNDLKIVYNERLNGIELYFDQKPSSEIISKMKEPNHRFYWHGKTKKWWAKRTPETESFVEMYLRPLYEKDVALESVEVEETLNKTNTDTKELPKTSSLSDDVLKKNCFGEFYERVGGAEIHKDSSLDFINFCNSYREGYFKDENLLLSIEPGGNTVHMIDLTHALEKGKECDSYSLRFKEPSKENISIYLCNEFKIKTVKDLILLLKCDDDLKLLKKNVSTVKGMDLFSPFKEVKPLESFPEKWTKATLKNALLSGQIYKGTVNYSYTGDEARDFSSNCMKGAKIDLALFAKDVIEHWCTGNNVTCKNKEGRSGVLHYSDVTSSIDLHVDLDCDIKTGLLRSENEKQQIEKENERNKKEILTLDDVAMEPNKFYLVSYLSENSNTGKLDLKHEFVQGAYVMDGDKFTWWYELMKKVEEVNIIPNNLYQVSNCNCPVPLPTDDKRFIPMGNQEVLVSGLALKELANNMLFYYVSDRPYCGRGFEDARRELQAFLDGSAHWAVDISKVNYKDSLERLSVEEERAMKVIDSFSNDKLIKKDPLKTKGEQVERHESLFDRIARIEAERKTGTYRKGTVRENNHTGLNR